MNKISRREAIAGILAGSATIVSVRQTAVGANSEEENTAAVLNGKKHRP